MKFFVEYFTGSFKEEYTTMIERENSFKNWTHDLPPPIELFKAGWSFTGSDDSVVCLYCHVEHHNWNVRDDPLAIHRQLSPSCPFVLSSQPLRPSQTPIKTLSELYTTNRIFHDIAQPKSNVILASTSPYSPPPKREESFSTFPNATSASIEALVQNGFYSSGEGTLVTCYSCGLCCDDIHNYPLTQMNMLHRIRSPHCTFARLLLDENRRTSASNFDLHDCRWRIYCLFHIFFLFI